MYCVLLVSVVLSHVTPVASHGGHVEDPTAKSPIQDALLSYLCRGTNGLQCSGHGTCQRGVCMCLDGYSGTKCEYSDVQPGVQPGGVNEVTEMPFMTGTDFHGLNFHDLLGILPDNETTPVSCHETDQRPCEGHGMCHAGVCVCDEGYSGLTCELSHDVGFCGTYRDCAECTSLMKICPDRCNKMAKFTLVFGFPTDKLGTTRLCRFKNSVMNCTFYFKDALKDERGMKTVLVKACLAHPGGAVRPGHGVEQSTHTSVTPNRTSQEVDHRHGDGRDDHHGDAGTKDSQGGGNGQTILTLNLLTIFTCLAVAKL